MALDKSMLKNSILNVLKSYPSTAYLAAEGIASAYYSYSSLATDPQGGLPQGLDVKKVNLITALNDIFSVLSLEVSPKITQLVEAFSNYWTGVVFVIPGGAGQSTVASLDGVEDLTSDLEEILQNLDVNKTFEDKADELADALHDFTTKVYVSGQLNTTPPTPYSGYIS